MDFGSPPVARCPLFLMGQLTALGTGRGLSQPSYQPLKSLSLDFAPADCASFVVHGPVSWFWHSRIAEPGCPLAGGSSALFAPIDGVADGTWGWQRVVATKLPAPSFAPARLAPSPRTLFAAVCLPYRGTGLMGPRNTKPSG
jgi:hypothetical protein